MKNIYTKHDFPHIGEFDAKNIYKLFLFHSLTLCARVRTIIII